MLRTGRRLAAAAVILISPSAAADGDAAADRFGTVVLDAGHGGEDEGAKGPRGALEKDVVLSVARQLSDELVRRGLRVVLTRSDDVFVSLEQRTHIANDASGHAFVSIHANAAPQQGIRGSETFFLSLDASDDAARQVAERENQAFGPGATLPPALDDPMVAIFGDLISNDTLRESQAFARMTQAQLARIDPDTSRGVKQAPFVVLSGVHMPAALVEVGFITNARDEDALRSRRGRQRIVTALAAAILEFGRRYDAVRGVPPRPASGAP